MVQQRKERITERFRYYDSAGATTGTATLDPTDDNVYEGNETAIIDISGVSGKSGVTENSTSKLVLQFQKMSRRQQ